jgi:hypothetical protein
MDIGGRSPAGPGSAISGPRQIATKSARSSQPRYVRPCSNLNRSPRSLGGRPALAVWAIRVRGFVGLTLCVAVLVSAVVGWAGGSAATHQRQVMPGAGRFGLWPLEAAHGASFGCGPRSQATAPPFETAWPCVTPARERGNCGTIPSCNSASPRKLSSPCRRHVTMAAGERAAWRPRRGFCWEPTDGDRPYATAHGRC